MGASTHVDSKGLQPVDSAALEPAELRVQKAYVGCSSDVTLVCPGCGKSRVFNVSGVRITEKPHKARCGCGVSFSVVFERRQYYRKSTNLVGCYSKHVNSDSFTGEMVVEDISCSGLKFTPSRMDDIQVGDLLSLEFRLNNSKKTRICCKVVVKNLLNGQVGAEFTFLDQHCKQEIGFYLLP